MKWPNNTYSWIRWCDLAVCLEIKVTAALQNKVQGIAQKCLKHTNDM